MIKGKVISVTPSKWLPSQSYVDAMTEQGVIRYVVSNKNRKEGQTVWLEERPKSLPWEETMWQEVER